MHHLVMVHPSNEKRNEHIRIYESYNPELLVAILKPIGIVVREATQQEIDQVEEEEQDMEAHEPDIGFEFPLQEQMIVDLARDWSRPLSLTDILRIVVSECHNSCTNVNHALDYFRKHYSNRVEMNEVHAYLNVLNFFAIREEKTALNKMLGKSDLVAVGN